MKMSIQKQLIWFSVFIVLSFILFGVYVISSVYKIKRSNYISEISRLSFFHLSQLQTAKSEFLLNASSDTAFILTGGNHQLTLFNSNIKSVMDYTDRLKGEKLLIDSEKNKLIDSLQFALTDYSSFFLETTDLIKEKGFKNIGLEGKMRKAIHFIEGSPLITDKTYILTLRRHEKDFLLRKDFQYVKKFDEDYKIFSNYISNLPEGGTGEKEELIKQLLIYKNTFYEIKNIEEHIGLHSDNGNRFLLNTKYKQAENYLSKLNSYLIQEADTLSSQVIGTFIFLFLIIGAGVSFILWWLQVSISNPIAEIRKAVEKISKGDLSANLDGIKSSRLLKSLILGFDNVVLKFREVMDQIEKISTRAIKEELPLENENDEITKMLNSIIAQLKTMDEAEKRRLWHSEGVSNFADMLRNSHHGNHKDVYDEVLKNFVKILGANQAALFVVEEDENETPLLELKACYAYSRIKFLNKRIALGEGLAGVAFVENHTFYITEIPDEYVQIKSGLGTANPACILIMPLSVNDEVIGVLELASFKKLEQYEIDFAKSVSESIASFIQNTKVSERTRDLLEKSKSMTQKLRDQEEELKQNMEEMLATQEEMRRHERELQYQLEKMSTENVQLRNKKATARKGDDDFIRSTGSENKWSANKQR